MKSILYVGATLMIGASIYGFVDYKKTSRHQEFHNMYNEKEKPVPAEIVTKAEEKKIADESVVTKEKTATTEPEKKIIAPVVNSEKKYQVAKKRRLNYKTFSRAPLRD